MFCDYVDHTFTVKREYGDSSEENEEEVSSEGTQAGVM